MEVILSAQLATLCKAGVVLAIALHALALVPQWQHKYFNPRFLQLSMYGLLLAVAHAAVVALAGSELPVARHVGGVAWCIAGAVLLNVVVGAQNLLAVLALVRLHRASAVIAHRMRPAVRPMVWGSAVLVLAAYARLHGWL